MPTDAPFAKAIGKRVKKYREEQHLTAEKFAERCQAAGLQWDRQMVANLELGRRGIVTVGEWLALAYALSVPPLVLLLPIGEADRIEVLPDLELHPNLVMKWITGNEPPVNSDRRVDFRRTDMTAWQRAAYPIWLYAQEDELWRKLQDVKVKIGHFEFTHGADSAAVVEARRVYLAALQEWAEKLQEMRRNEVRPAAIDPQLYADMQRAGITVEGLDVLQVEDEDDAG